MTYSIEVIISQPMSLQFSHYHMIKMATKNSFYHLFYLLCAIQLPFQQRVHINAPLATARHNPSKLGFCSRLAQTFSICVLVCEAPIVIQKFLKVRFSFDIFGCARQYEQALYCTRLHENSRQAKSNKFSLVFWLNEIVPLRRNRYNSYPIYLDVNRASRLGLLLCLTDETKDLH